MIKSKELRQENIIGHNRNDNVIGTVLGISGPNVVIKKGKTEYCVHEMDLEGIPLTEEWLIKFNGGKNQSLYRFCPINMGLVDDDFIKEQWTARINSEYHVKIKYVHQLQNLYFALTGEELTIVDRIVEPKNPSIAS